MLFASFDFLLFLAPFVVCFWWLRGPWRWWLALVASYFFYMAGPKPVSGSLPAPWYFAGLLLLSTLVDFVAGLQIARARARLGLPCGAMEQRAPVAGDGGLLAAEGRQVPQPDLSVRAGNGWLWLSLLANLGLLSYFKYTGFLLQIGGQCAELLGMPGLVPLFKPLLPIGISFYTFQSLSYTLDVWRGQLAAEKSFLRFSVFVCFFPQLVAGPIVRASELLPQFHKRQRLSVDDVNFAVWRISKGLIKKVLLGDYIAASFADLVFAAPSEFSSVENLLALYAFTLQIYADFSGYSDIAIGVARLLGFHLPENFDRPYISQSVGEFWRRWHMTLSTWLRDYLFFPLGGSRAAPGRVYFNIWLTMFLVGMWHGASWNFVIYSNLQAAAMLYNRFHLLRVKQSALAQLAGSIGIALAFSGLVYLVVKWGLDVSDGAEGLALGAGLLALGVGFVPKAGNSVFLRAVHIALTFHFCTLSRVFFRADDSRRAAEMIGQLLSLDGLGVRPGLFRIQILADWLELSNEQLEQLWALPVQWGILLLMGLGLASQLVPSVRVEALGLGWVRRRSAPVLAVALGGVVLLLSLLLTGPRANIYFAF